MPPPSDWWTLPWLPQALELLRSPWGAAAFVPLYALWVTLLLQDPLLEPVRRPGL